MAGVSDDAVAGDADIPVRNHVRTADMRLVACCNADVAGGGADGAGTLALCCPGFMAVVGGLAGAEGDTDTTGPHKTGFLRFLKAP